ncbi:hypothetical protein ACH4TQ_49045 [Streptomyces sp. NPDC021218]|uniref:hypothetical protein n=1 Tax=unclassified Streptomyces TaxID=2593676 RepID=UPI00369BC420
MDGVMHDHVQVLAEVEKSLPPIVVHRSTKRVIDGMHRLYAARLKGRKEIAVEYFDGSERDAFLLAVEANMQHGLPLTLSDRREVAIHLLQTYPGWSDSAIGEKAGLSSKTVAKLRQENTGENTPVEVRVGRDGRARPLNATDGRMRASAIMDERPEASLREIARGAGISLGTARDVRQRRKRGESPLPRGRGADKKPLSLRHPALETRPVDLVSMLTSLRSDPTLRYSEAGRSLLRWLDARILREEEIRAAAGVPVHRRPMVATMARRCAALWEQVATELEKPEDEAEPMPGPSLPAHRGLASVDGTAHRPRRTGRPAS